MKKASDQIMRSSEGAKRLECANHGGRSLFSILGSVAPVFSRMFCCFARSLDWALCICQNWQAKPRFADSGQWSADALKADTTVRRAETETAVKQTSMACRICRNAGTRNTGTSRNTPKTRNTPRNQQHLPENPEHLRMCL